MELRETIVKEVEKVGGEILSMTEEKVTIEMKVPMRAFVIGKALNRLNLKRKAGNRLCVKTKGSKIFITKG